MNKNRHFTNAIYICLSRLQNINSVQCRTQEASRGGSTVTVLQLLKYQQRRGLSLSKASRLDLGPFNPPTEGLIEVLSMGVKRPEHEAERSALPRAKLRTSTNLWCVPVSTKWHALRLRIKDKVFRYAK